MNEKRTKVVIALFLVLISVGLTVSCKNPTAHNPVAQKVVAPVVAPVSGIITPSTDITISTSTAGASIYYTTDGSDPTDADSLYSGPFQLPVGSQTIKAFAVLAGMTDSDVGVPADFIVQNTVADVAFSPAAGDIPDNADITLSSTAGATIYYTTDGGDPTTGSSVYASPLTLAGIGSDSVTIKAFSTLAGYTDSGITQAAYSKAQAAEPVSDQTDGSTITDTTPITLTTTSTGVDIYYTTNGDVPTVASTLYTAPFALASSGTLKSIAIGAGYVDSTVMTASYTVIHAVADVTFSVPDGAIADNQDIVLFTPTPGATIHYTTNGSDPTTGSSTYSSALTLSGLGLDTVTIKAFAVAGGYTDSGITQADYTKGVVAAPVSDAADGSTITDLTPITLTTTTAGASIYYTTDGSPPTILSNPYTAPFTLTAGNPIILKAIALLSGYTDSTVTTASLTVEAQADAPVSDQADGTTILATMPITLTTTTPLATIYYTTDGNDPTTGSTSYTVPFNLPLGNHTVKAFAVAAGFVDSEITTVNLTVAVQAGLPTISEASGVVQTGTAVTLTVAGGETIYYTTDGSDPTVGGSVYSTPLTLTSKTTLRAYAGGTNYYPSAEVTADYWIYESVDTLVADVGALIAIAADGSVVVHSGGYYDLVAGSLTSRSVTGEPGGSVLDFVVDASGHIHGIYLDGTDVKYWTSDGGLIGTVSTTAVTLADARILLDSSGNSRIVFIENLVDIVEAVYSSGGAYVGRSTKSLSFNALALDAAIGTDTVYIAATRGKNGAQPNSPVTEVGSFDALDGGTWTPKHQANFGNPALAVEADGDLLFAYVRDDAQKWFVVYEVEYANELLRVSGGDFTTAVAGDSNLAIDSDGDIYAASHGYAWVVTGIAEYAVPMGEAPYRVVADPSGNVDTYLMGTAGLTLYEMK